MTNPRTAGYDWAATLPPGQPTPTEDIEAAYAAYASLSLSTFYQLVAKEGSIPGYEAFRAGAYDFGAAEREPRPLFYGDGEVFQPWQIATANGLIERGIRAHILRGSLTARKHGKLYLIEPADYAAWWYRRQRRG